MAENNKLYKLIFLRNLRRYTQSYSTSFNRIYKKHSNISTAHPVAPVLAIECDRLIRQAHYYYSLPGIFMALITAWLTAKFGTALRLF